VTGTNFIAGTGTTTFVPGSTVYLGTTLLAALTGSSTVITATVPAGLIAAPGALKVTVHNGSASAVSAASTLTVTGPKISLLNPIAVPAGSADTTLTITGTNFIAGSTAFLGTTALAITAQTATSITATVPAASMAVAGAQKVTIQNGSVSVVSAASTFTVNGPKITTLSPTSTVAGASGFTLTVTGTNFLNGSTVVWGTMSLVTTYGGPTSLTAAVTTAEVADAGAIAVYVKNPGGAVSPTATFTVTGAPTLARLSPASATAGGVGFTLTVTGTHFVAGSTVMWGATALTTTFGSATSLTATVLASGITSAGPVSVTVVLPDGATTSAIVFTVNTNLT
jgi:hypothetical protein